MTILEPHLPEARSLEEIRSPSLGRSQRKTIRAWMLALPFGWLSGWALGAAVGYRNPALLNPVSPWMDWNITQKIGASDGGLRGGAIGVTIGFVVAAWITISSLRSAIPALRPMQAVIVILAWTLPWILFLVAAYFLGIGF